MPEGVGDGGAARHSGVTVKKLWGGPPGSRGPTNSASSAPPSMQTQTLTIRWVLNRFGGAG